MGNKKWFDDLVKTKIKDISFDRSLTSSRIWLEVWDVMSNDVITISPDETVVTAAKVMSENNASCIVVIDEGSVAGILTETDLLRRVAGRGGHLDRILVHEVMTYPVQTITPNLSVLEASGIMEGRHIKRLPVLQENRLVGIVTQTDLVRALASYGMWRDVKEIMNSDVAGLLRNKTVEEAAEVMASRNISCIVVLEGDETVGVLTERDILRKVVALQRDPAQTKLEDVMSSPVISVPPYYSVFSSSRIMEKMHIRRLIVMEDKRLCGVVTQTDVFRAIKGKLQVEEEKNYRLLEKCKSGIYTADLDGKVTYVNLAFMKLLKVRKPAEFIGQPILPGRFWFDPKDRKGFLQEIEKGSVKVKELALKNAKGKKIYVTVFSTFAKNIHGEINGSQGILYDITAKKELVTLRDAQKALRESEALLSKAELISDFGSWDWDLATNKLKWSNGLCKIFGIEPGKFENKYESFLKFVHPDDIEKVKKHVEEAIRGIRPLDYDHKIIRHDGAERVIHVRGEVTFGENNKAVRMLGTAHDVTERRRAEQELKQAKEKADAANEQLKSAIRRANQLAEEAMSADKTKSQFLANMSHEIRTPLNAIIGFSQVLAEGNLTDEQRNHISIICESAENLLEMINDVLDFSKIEAGKFNVEIVDCSLEYLLAVVESLMRPSAKEKGLMFEVLQCGELPVQIRSDPIRLRQCLINLINNAIKFTDQGHVYLNVSMKELGTEENPKPYICFDVEDTGIGIPADKHELIFDEFMQVDAGTSRRYGGTGLGLPITKKLTNLLGGELTLTSEAGKGSVFSLRVPVGADVKSQPSLDRYEFINKLDKVQSTSRKIKFFGRVLVAEDSQTNQMLIKLLLEQLGLEVTIAQDGKEATDKALSQPFDLIFMDIQMPNVNGYEATRELRRKGLKTPIVALTAYAMKGDDVKCFSAGCTDYLPKPIDHKRLLKTIRKYLTSQETTLNQSIDSVGSQVDELGRLCHSAKSSQSQSEERHVIQGAENIIDWASVMSICDNEDIIREIAVAILEDGPRSIKSIDRAIEKQNPSDIQLYAHKLKGAALSVGAKQLSEKAYRLECAGQEKNMTAAPSLLNDVRSEFEKLASFLSRANWIEIVKHQEIKKRTVKTN